MPSRSSTSAAPNRAAIRETKVSRFQSSAATTLFRSIVSFGRGLVIPFLPFVAEDRGASLSIIGVLLATNILLAGFMQIPFGRLADRVSKPLLMGLGIVGFAMLLSRGQPVSARRVYWVAGAALATLVNSWWLALLLMVFYKFYILREDT